MTPAATLAAVAPRNVVLGLAALSAEPDTAPAFCGDPLAWTLFGCSPVQATRSRWFILGTNASRITTGATAICIRFEAVQAIAGDLFLRHIESGFIEASSVFNISKVQDEWLFTNS